MSVCLCVYLPVCPSVPVCVSVCVPASVCCVSPGVVACASLTGGLWVPGAARFADRFTEPVETADDALAAVSGAGAAAAFERPGTVASAEARPGAALGEHSTTRQCQPAGAATGGLANVERVSRRRCERRARER